MRWVGLIVGGAVAAQGMPAAAQSDAGSFRKLMADCEAATDTTARLSCFESAARRLRSMPDTAFLTPENSIEREKRQRSLFGLFGPRRDEEKRRVDPTAPAEIKEVTAPVLARAEATRGSWLIVLKDGGTWKTETDMSFQPPRVGTSATIRRSPFGGYLLDVGNQASQRVTRLN